MMHATDPLVLAVAKQAMAAEGLARGLLLALDLVSMSRLMAEALLALDLVMAMASSRHETCQSVISKLISKSSDGFQNKWSANTVIKL